MKAAIIRIGNGRGIRLPRPLLAQCKVGDTVEILVRDRELVIRPARAARHGWDQAFARLAKRGEDELLDSGAEQSSAWDQQDWRW